MRIFSSQRFLAVYSGVLTVVFAVTVFALLRRPVLASGAESTTFDQITVHRINVVEQDGTPRMVIANAAQFPGGYFHGKEAERPSRKSAGLLFINDEGTEDGGLIFGGYKDAQGVEHAYGHLSFDEYERDQAMTEDMQQDGGAHSARYVVNDTGAGHITPEVMDAFNAVQAMPTDTPEHVVAAKKAMEAMLKKYPVSTVPRASMGRERDSSAALHLRDAQGRDRIVLRVTADGTPTMQFLDAAGKATAQWPAK